jgi:aminoglycoside/choline kinase family phosphotransferase
VDEPRRAIRDWLDRSFPGANVTSLAGDASTRRFLRIAPSRSPSMILMDYGSPFEGETDDIRLTRVFLDACLPVARIRAVAPDPGCLVLDDLGDRMLERELQEHPSDSPKLLARAVDLALTIAIRGTPALERSPRLAGPSLDQARFRFEMEFFVKHFVGSYLGRPAEPDLIRGLEALADEAAQTSRPVLCHRDFHSRNIMLRDDRSLALVDIQDAQWGPETYDLASLLYDAYVEIDDEWRDPLIEGFRSALPNAPDRETFRAQLWVVSAERMIKALGTFGYQVAVQGNSRYRDAIPRTLQRLERLLPRVEQVPRLGAAFQDAGILGDD